MFSLIVVAVVVYLILKFVGGRNKTETTPNTPSAPSPIAASIQTLRNETSDVVNQVREAGTKARETYNQVQQEKELSELLARFQREPGLVAQMAAMQAERKLSEQQTDTED